MDVFAVSPVAAILPVVANTYLPTRFRIYFNEALGVLGFVILGVGMYNFRGFFSEVNGLQVDVIHSPGKTLCSLELPILPVIDHDGGTGTSDSMLVEFSSISKIIRDVGHR